MHYTITLSKKELIDINVSLTICAQDIRMENGSEDPDSKYLEELASDILIRAKEVKEGEI